MKTELYLRVIVVAFSITFLIGSCKKTDLSNKPSNEGQPSAVIEAKGYFESNIQKPSLGEIQTESTDRPHSPSRSPIWNKAYVMTLSIGPAVIIPLQYDRKSLFRSNLDSSHLYDMDFTSKLAIYKDPVGKFHTEVVNMYPDSLEAKRSGFTGIIKVEDWNGNFTNEFKYEGNKIKKYVTDVSEGKTSTNAVTQNKVAINITMVIQTDYYNVTYTYAVSNPSGGTYSYNYLGSSYSFIDYNEDGTGLSGSDYKNIGNGGGAGAQSKASSSTVLTVETGNNPITDIKEYIKCFNGDLNATYTVSLCVAQPIFGERDAYSSAYNGVNVGHTFLTFQQNAGGVVTTRSMGFYPNGIVTPASPRASGSLNNDQGHKYNVSITYSTTGSQFMNILNSFSSGNNVNYDLNANNCTTWALSSLSAGGINISTTQGSWPFGGGDDPGDLGEDIRSMSVSPNSQRSFANTEAPVNNGTCP
jgi:hypothetical protein